MVELELLKAMLPEALMENFDVVRFEKTADRFDIWLDEKKTPPEGGRDAVSNGFDEYRSFRDFPIRGRASYIHARRRKWVDRDSGEVFSRELDSSEYGGTRLNAEFAAFLKGGD